MLLNISLYVNTGSRYPWGFIIPWGTSSLGMAGTYLVPGGLYQDRIIRWEESQTLLRWRTVLPRGYLTPWSCFFTSKVGVIISCSQCCWGLRETVDTGLHVSVKKCCVSQPAIHPNLAKTKQGRSFHFWRWRSLAEVQIAESPCTGKETKLIGMED